MWRRLGEDDGEFGGFPGGEAAGDFYQLGDAVVLQDARGDGGAVTAATEDGDGAVGWEFGEALLQVVQRDVQAAGDVAGGPLGGRADVEEQRWGWGCEFLGGGLDADAVDGAEEVGTGCGGGHATFEVAADVVEADAAEAEGGLFFAAGFGDESDGAGAVEDGAGPGGVGAGEADVDGGGEMAGGVLGRFTDVEELEIWGEDFVEGEGLEALCESGGEGGALAGVEDGVVGEVGRGVGLVSGDEGDELVAGHGLEGVVEGALLAEGGDGVGRELLAAEGAGAVAGVDEGGIGEREEFGVEGVVEVGAELGGGEAEGGAEVGAAYVADEEGVAGENGLGVDGVELRVEDEDADGLDGVAGGFEDLEAEVGESEGVAVVHGDEGVLGLGAGAEMDDGAGGVA